MSTKEYQNEIVKMVCEIKNPQMLKFLYAITEDTFKDYLYQPFLQLSSPNHFADGQKAINNT